MTTAPDQIRDEIERTRAGLSEDVNQLADSVDPRQIAMRQADKVKDAVVGVKDKVMGTVGQDGTTGSVARSPQRAAGWARGQTTSNPWAAGMVALGVGWMIGSVLPATKVERTTTERVTEQAKAGLSDTMGTAVGEMSDHLSVPVSDAIENIKSTAKQATDNVKDTASPNGQSSS